LLRACFILFTGFCNGNFYPETLKPVPYSLLFISLLHKQKRIYPDNGCVRFKAVKDQFIVSILRDKPNEHYLLKDCECFFFEKTMPPIDFLVYL